MVDRRLMVDAREWLGAPDCRIYQAKGLKRARLPNIRSERIYRDAKVQLVAEAGRWPTWLRSALTLSNRTHPWLMPPVGSQPNRCPRSLQIKSNRTPKLIVIQCANSRRELRVCWTRWRS